MSQLNSQVAEPHTDRDLSEWLEDRETGLEHKGLSKVFERSAVEIHRQLVDDEEGYSLSDVRRALLEWLDAATEDLLNDAVHHVLGPSGSGAARFRAALQAASRAKLVPATVENDFAVVEPATIPVPEIPEIYTGRRPFSAAALREMIVFFASKPGGVLKTKLNKLLWYADLLSFRHTQISLSGATYVHLPFGPVPDQYKAHIASLCTDGVLSLSEQSVGGFTGECLQATRDPELSALNPGAVDFLEAVHRRFARLGSREISEISHAEPGYLETKQGEPISYEYARRLKTVIPPVRGSW